MKRRLLKTLNAATIVLAVVYGGYRIFLEWRTQVKKSEIRRQGFPTSLAELDELYPQPPAGENAADVFAEAFKHYANWESNKLAQLPIFGLAQLPPCGQPLPEEMKTLIAEYLAANRDALVLLHRGVAMRRARFPINFKIAKPMVIIPHLRRLHRGAKILYLEALMNAEENDPQLTARSVKSVFGLAHSLAAEPNLLSQLVRRVCQHIGILALNRAIDCVTLTDNDYIELDGELHRGEDPRAIQLGLEAERCEGLDLFSIVGLNFGDFKELLSNGQSELRTDYHLSRGTLFLYYTTGFKDLDMLCYMDLLDAYIKVSKEPVDKRCHDIQPINDRIQMLPQRCLISRMLTEALATAVLKDLWGIARLRTARAAVAVERYRLANRSLPDSLADLVPQFDDVIPADPFDGQPLRYKKLAKGYVVYSVGEDGKDDGGDEKKDITFTVER